MIAEKPALAPREAAIVVAVFAALWFAPLALGDYWLELGFRALIYFALAEGWNLMAGSAGLVSLGTSSFVGLGAYVAYGLLNGVSAPLPIALIATAGAGAGLAGIVSPALFRLRGLYFTVGTLALAELLRLLMINVSAFGGATGIFLKSDPPPLPILFHFALVVALIAALILTPCVRTRASVIFRSVRDDEDAAAQMGVRPYRVKLAAFTLAGALAAMAGAVQAVKLGAIEPYGMFGLQWSVDVLTMVIIGGMGSRLGPLVGALFVIALGEALADYPEAHIAIAGFILIVLIRIAPKGLVGLASNLRLAAAKRASMTPLLEVKSLSKRFGGLVAIDNLDLKLMPGAIAGVIGPNGAGKSTLIGLIGGALGPSSGAIALDGRDVTRLPASERARAGIGRTYQIPRPFLDMTVEENLEVAQYAIEPFISARAAHAARNDLLVGCGLVDAASLPARALPLLRRKRLEVARALALKPRVLLLDQVGAGLIASEIGELIALIKQIAQPERSILIVEHVIRVVRECCARSVVLNFGKKLIEGPTAEILANDEVAAIYLGTRAGAARKGADEASGSVAPEIEVGEPNKERATLAPLVASRGTRAVRF